MYDDGSINKKLINYNQQIKLEMENEDIYYKTLFVEDKSNILIIFLIYKDLVRPTNEERKLLVNEQ